MRLESISLHVKKKAFRCWISQVKGVTWIFPNDCKAIVEKWVNDKSTICQVLDKFKWIWFKCAKCLVDLKLVKVLVSHSKSPSLIFDQRILKLFKIVSGYAICIKLSGSYKSLPKTICEWHIFEWEQYKSQIQICRNIVWVRVVTHTQICWEHIFEWELKGVILKCVFDTLRIKAQALINNDLWGVEVDNKCIMILCSIL